MKRFRFYTLVENTFMPMLLPEKEKELQFRSISMLMLTQVVELKTFHVEITMSPNCILLFIYPHFITLNTRTAAVKKKKKLHYWNVITHLLRVNAMKNLRFNSAFFETATRC